jgi:16S rRNA (guanine527-N7)-methyltransferase
VITIFSEALQAAAEAAGIHFSSLQEDQLTTYQELLLTWNEKVNLTAITDPQEVAVKHMIDSLSCYDQVLFSDSCSLLDVGTGAGFPGLPLKIFRPDISLTLMDSLNKRLLFLEQVVATLSLQHVTLVHSRAEDAGRQVAHRGQYQLVVSRAVARLRVLAELCLPLTKPGGYFIALKGSQFREELTEAAEALKLLGGKVVDVRQIKLPGLDDGRAVIYVEKVGPIAATYPRRAGLPEKKPL